MRAGARLAPFGRRPARSPATSSRAATGSSRSSTATAPRPAAGQFYMLADGSRTGAGRTAAPISGAPSRSPTAKRRGRERTPARLPRPGRRPGDRTALRSGAGRAAVGHRTAGPLVLARPPSSARARPGRSWSAAGSGSRRWRSGAAASRRRGLRPGCCSASATRRTAGGLELFDCSEVRFASEDGHRGHRGYVTDLLAVLLEGDDAAGAAVYACGPPAMLEAVRALCAERGVACELAMEAPMACGFGACFGCAVPLADGGYMRLCVDGPVVRGDEIETALVPGSGHWPTEWVADAGSAAGSSSHTR